MNIREEVESIKAQVLEWRALFHQYPELAQQEYKTTQLIEEILTELQIPWEQMESTGVIGYLGERGGKTVALRADIDGLVVKEETGLPFSSKIPGQMHACGHDGHIAGLLAAAKILKKYEKDIKGCIKLIFQPAEENSAGANLVMDQGHLDDVEEIFGIHIFSDIPSGVVSVEAGPRMAATDHFTITIHGKAGHAAKPHQCIDATIVAAALVMNLQTILSRRMDPLEDGVLTIGKLESGTAYNVISGKAVLEGTVRTFTMEAEEQVRTLVTQMAHDTAKMYGATAEVDYPLPMHPSLINDEAVAERMQPLLQEWFSEEERQKVPKLMLGEDFTNYLQRIPGVFAFVGGGKPGETIYPNHHNKFDFTEEALTHSAMLHLVYALSTIF